MKPQRWGQEYRGRCQCPGSLHGQHVKALEEQRGDSSYLLTDYIDKATSPLPVLEKQASFVKGPEGRDTE